MANRDALRRNGRRTPTLAALARIIVFGYKVNVRAGKPLSFGVASPSITLGDSGPS